MSKKPLDPNLASILDSIRATVGGEAPPPSGQEMRAMPDTGTQDPGGAAESIPETDQRSATRAMPAASAGKPAVRKAIPPAGKTVEEFLAELIRPQVEAWLSAHLPEIIQRQAAEEIARLTGRKQP
ncbi:MAG: DUF2497 domain-containing protein [Sandarakinorhabdus sp.]|nr:DUF2497 domain-containing protein [Sandarakinorhabdus sp.]